MRFFDYKFLILLGLTLVVYFIYREVEYLRNKVDKIEAELNQKKLILTSDDKCSLELKDQKPNQPAKEEITNSVSKPVLPLPSNPDSKTNANVNVNVNANALQALEEKPESVNNQIQVMSPELKKTLSPQGAISRSPQKLISLDLVSQSIQSPPSNSSGQGYARSDIKIPTNIRPESSNSKEAGIKINKIMNKITDILQEKSEDSDDSDDEEGTTTDLSTESSKHLAIYSNDNEQFDSTQNSLMESVEANKNEVHFNYNMDIPDLKATMDDIINSLTSDKEAKSNNDSDAKLSNESNQGHNKEQTNNLIDLESLQKARQQEIEEIIAEKEKQLTEMSQKSESGSEKSKSASEKSKKLSEKPKSPKSNKKEDKYTEVELNDKKLSDIKEIAGKLGITFSKKVNGQQKQKSKQELINEILQK